MNSGTYTKAGAASKLGSQLTSVPAQSQPNAPAGKWVPLVWTIVDCHWLIVDGLLNHQLSTINL